MTRAHAKYMYENHAYFGKKIISKETSILLHLVTIIVFFVVIAVTIFWVYKFNTDPVSVTQNINNYMYFILGVGGFSMLMMNHNSILPKGPYEEDVLVRNSFTNSPEYIYILKVDYIKNYLYDDENSKVKFIAINDQNLNDPNGNYVVKTIDYNTLKNSYELLNIDLMESVQSKLKDRVSELKISNKGDL